MARRETAARRYAEAAFEIGRDDGALERWQTDLDTLTNLLRGDELRALVEHPAVPFATKERVLRRVATGVVPEVLSLVLLMIRRGRPGAIRRMTEHFRALVRRQQGVALAEVRTALPVDDAQRAALTQRLREMTGRDVEIDAAVDESLMGGITVRIDDRLYDASVRTRLERLRARLTAV
jgi:F-type H+-transporting ATPase subunit delta